MIRLPSAVRALFRPRVVAPPAAAPDTLRIARLWQLGEVAATLSHELGQPLNIMRLTAEAALDALDRGQSSPERLRRALTTSVEQTQRAQAMIDALVAAARKPGEAARPIRPVEAVRRALRSVLPRLRSHGVRLSWHAELPSPRVAGHAARLQMAVTQALINACEALAGQELLDPARPASLSVRCHAQGSQVVIAIQDNGSGFPPSLLESLDALLPDTGGKRCGIGLPIMLGVAAEMGGSVHILDAAPGTCVELRLPALPGPSVLLAGCRRAGLADFLARRGWSVREAESGPAALAQVEAGPPDAVLTGLSGTERDGLTATLRARAPLLPVIAIAQSAEDLHRAMDAGAILVLQEPVLFEDIARELREIAEE